MVSSTPSSNRWLTAYAVLVAVCAWLLVCLGGLVTSKGVGMAVPDWPTSFGYNMFALPASTWFTGGVFHEHTHRLWASTVGTLVVALTRWLGGRQSRKALMVIGVVELVAGGVLLGLGPDWKGAGHFLMGIGGVVLLAGVVWFRNERAQGPLPWLGWLVFWVVQLQGLLGGLRVVLDKEVFAGTTLGMLFGIFHGCLGQAFLVLLCVIALYVTRFWNQLTPQADTHSKPNALGWLLPLATVLIFTQLLLGALMRHQHAGLAIHDFPLAYGELWPATDAESLVRYNQHRAEESVVTAFQIHLQMFHRLGAVAALVAVLAVWLSAIRTVGLKSVMGRGTSFWAAVLLLQVVLGMYTIWTNKAADIATAHVAVGALSLVTGCLLILIARRLALRGNVSPAPRVAPSFATPVTR